jgi:hypothetical protein
MDSDADDLQTLTTVTTDFEASAIVSALEAEDIRARAVGGYTAGFRAEAPGSVSVIVAEADLERAKKVLDELRRHGAEVDWSQVDVERPEDGA